MLLLLTYFLLIIKYSGISNKFRKWIHPRKRVYTLNNNCIEEITKLDETYFKNELSEEEIDIAVQLYSSRNNSNPFNGDAVRLDNIILTNNGKLNIEISLVTFFDFLSTNLSIYPANSPISSFNNVILTIWRSWKSFEIIGKVKNSVYKYGKIRSFHDVIKIKSLANIITVSLLVIDIDNRLGIIQRSKKVAISSGNFSVTAAGTLSKEDYENSDNPFIACIKREAQEELNFYDIDIVFDEIIISKQKLQPVFCFTAKLNTRWEDNIDNIKSAKDFSFETKSIFAVPLNKSISFISQTVMTDASAYQIWKYVTNQTRKDNWLISSLTPLRIKKYELK